MKNLPLGIQNFAEIVAGDYLYVDMNKAMALAPQFCSFFYFLRYN